MFASTDVSIARAVRNGTIRIVERIGRFGDKYWAIVDGFGVIEVHNTLEDAERRVAS